MPENREPIMLATLRHVGARPAGAGFERPAIAGYTREQIDAAVDELRRGGHLRAAYVDKAFGDNPSHWAPSELSPQGRRLLEELEGGGWRGTRSK